MDPGPKKMEPGPKKMEPGPKKMDLGTEQDPIGILAPRKKMGPVPKKMDLGSKKMDPGPKKIGPRSDFFGGSDFRSETALRKWIQVRKKWDQVGKMDL